MKADSLRQETCCFTGHRYLPPHKIQEISIRTISAISSLVTEYGVRFFGVGGAIGFDTLAANLLFHLRETKFPHIKVILVYPFQGFHNRWSEKQIAQYETLLPKFDKTVCVSDHASKSAYLARNRHLVDHSAHCIAYCTHRNSGSAYTINYAHMQNLHIQNIADG